LILDSEQIAYIHTTSKRHLFSVLVKMAVSLFTLVTAASAGFGYIWSSGRIQQLPPVGFLGAFFGLWSFSLVLWAFWTVILYPKFFSPLRHLPEPGEHTHVAQEI
jgi:hypothetical protein